MNERIARQIEEMKKQTIGVEVEMNSITREKAARIAATFFGTGRYEDTASRNGYRLGRHGTDREGNGNSKGTSALRELKARNANW